MHAFRLTLKNYRCFPDSSPLRLEFRPGFTAFVGPNNAGKSTALRFFHEMKGLWQKIGPQSGEMQAWFNGQRVGVSYEDVVDAEELFFNGNARDLSFRLELVDVGDTQGEVRQLTGMEGRLSRGEPQNWTINFLFGPNHQQLAAGPGKWKDVNGKIGFHISAVRIDLAPLTDLALELARSLFIPAFRNAINQGSGMFYGMSVGTQFIDEFKQWKTSLNKNQGRVISRITEDIRSVFGFNSLNIEVSDAHRTLAVWIDGQQYRLAELGSGIAQFIVILGNAGIKKPPLIFIDEPEINLHPALQVAFLMALAAYADGNIFFATHSIGLARSTAIAIYSFQRTRSSAPRVSLIEGTPNYAEFLGEMSFSAFQELGCDSVLLVEGASDIKTFQQFLRKLQKDAHVVVIHLGGRAMAAGGREQELADLRRITQRVFAIVDSERDHAGAEPIAERIAFRESCQKLGIEVHLTERRAIENYFPDAAVKEVCGPNVAALAAYETVNGRWDKSHDNWRIAAAMSKADLDATDVGQFLTRVLPKSG